MADVRDAPLRSHDAMQVPGRNGMDSVIYARRGRSQGHVQPHHRHTIIAIYGMLYPCPKLPPVANRTGIKNGQDDLVTLLMSVSYTHLRAHETRHDLVCRLLL